MQAVQSEIHNSKNGHKQNNMNPSPIKSSILERQDTI